MKKIVLLILTVLLLIVFVACDSNEKPTSVTTVVSTTQAKKTVYPYLSVIDYKTKKEVVRFTQSDYEKANTVFMLYSADIKVPNGMIHNDANYTVKLVQTKERKDEVWFNVYFYDGKVYSQKLGIKGTADEKIKDAYQMYESDLTEQEFLEIIGK